MPRGIGRPGGRKTSLNPLTHGGHRLEIRQARTPSATQKFIERKKKKKERSAMAANTRTKLPAMKKRSS